VSEQGQRHSKENKRPKTPRVEPTPTNVQVGEPLLAAGESYKFTLPPIAQPAGEAALHLSVTATFWLPGSALERRLVSVQTLRLPVQ